MKVFKSWDTFKITGKREIVFMVDCAKEGIPVKGEVVLIDQKEHLVEKAEGPIKCMCKTPHQELAIIVKETHALERKA